MLIRYINHSLHDITNTVIQKLLEESSGNDTFCNAEFVLTELPTAIRKQTLKQNFFAYSASNDFGPYVFPIQNYL